MFSKKILMSFASLVLSGMFFLIPPTHAASTPFVQGSGYQSGAYDTDAMQPTSFNWDRNSRFAGVTEDVYIKWSYTTPAPGNASLILDENGSVITKSFIGGDPKYSIQAINPNGTLKWVYNTNDEMTMGSPVINKEDKLIIMGADKLKSINLNDGIGTETKFGEAYPTQIAIDDKGVYYLVGPMRVAAYYPNGTLKWKASHNYSRGSYPILTKTGSLVFKAGNGTAGSLYSFNAETGQKNWEYGLPSNSNNTAPAVSVDGTIYASDRLGYTYAIDPTGTMKWSFKADAASTSANIVDPVVSHDGTIYVVNATKNLYALNSDGTIKWVYNTNYGINSSPIVDKNGDVFFFSQSAANAIDKNGKLIWSLSIEGSAFNSPAIAEDGTIYAHANNGILYAIGGKVKQDSEDPETEIPVEPEIPSSGRALLVIMLQNGVEREYDLSMSEVNAFVNWYESKSGGIGNITFAIDKHSNNLGPFKQRKDYILYDKIITFEINEY
ncbi:PQQ-binding-like beta-propeller repeat protein [Paenibacillus xylanilyticus]|uniref:outer membrane protein assembly factor BamB family protein n=1 Tax=Paenibacillus xylanilyticus TaxID=248903 RepID=UPI001F18CC6D|nr:PQQ-binding-like beta-propeller repeat protein [Paenibacillus xylanilyticus]